MNCRLTGIICLWIVAWPGVAPAQTNAVPDFSGLWTRKWVTPSTYDAPQAGPGPVMIDESQPHHGHREGVPGLPDVSSNAWVADYSNPILKPETREVVKRITEEELAGHPRVEHQTLCMPSGVPEILNLRDNMQMLVSPSGKEITMLYWRDSQVRHVYFDAEHSKNPPKTWYGESIGRYEGDTLVIDTIGLNDKTYIDNYRTPHTTQMHVIERWKLAADAKSIDVSVYVEDPGALTTPYRAMQRWLRRENTTLPVTPCNENNDDKFNEGLVPLAHADKPDF